MAVGLFGASMGFGQGGAFLVVTWAPDREGPHWNSSKTLHPAKSANAPKPYILNPKP